MKYKGFIIGEYYSSWGRKYLKEAPKYYIFSHDINSESKYLIRNLTLDSACGIENMYNSIEEAEKIIDAYILQNNSMNEFIEKKEFQI